MCASHSRSRQSVWGHGEALPGTRSCCRGKTAGLRGKGGRVFRDFGVRTRQISDCFGSANASGRSSVRSAPGPTFPSLSSPWRRLTRATLRASCSRRRASSWRRRAGASRPARVHRGGASPAPRFERLMLPCRPQRGFLPQRTRLRHGTTCQQRLCVAVRPAVPPHAAPSPTFPLSQSPTPQGDKIGEDPFSEGDFETFRGNFRDFWDRLARRRKRPAPRAHVFPFAFFALTFSRCAKVTLSRLSVRPGPRGRGRGHPRLLRLHPHPVPRRNLRVRAEHEMTP